MSAPILNDLEIWRDDDDTRFCPRCADEYRTGNHRCQLADGSVACYECAVDMHEPIMPAAEVTP
jgi:hypothetical protein